ncbi:MAG: stage 0 sporulation family protein [Dehalococcoidales bacterium]|nr:stage 0 sporulation family protein [Dehalococcoidales bacterium]
MDDVTPTNQNSENTTPPQTAPVTPAAPSPAAPPPEVKIVGVRFKRAGRIYYFDPKDMDFKLEDWVVVETTRGMEIGRVAIAPEQVLVSEVELPLKPVLRKAEPAEAKHTQETQQKEHEALVECGKMISRLNLPMKLLAAEYSLDGNHITFFFSAAERVDFRELVRELAGRFKVRVELRQVGARDEAKIVGGYGRCGRQLCCCSFLSDFVPISIKMAKEQGLPLNPMKISGVCGRLLCCLAYEHDTYHEMRNKMPREGQAVTTPMGKARVVGGNPLKGTAVVELETQVTVELPISDLKYDVNAPPDRIETNLNREANSQGKQENIQ